MGLAFYVGRVPRSGKFLDIPFSQIATFVVGIMGGAYACTQLNTALWGNEPATLAKEWQAENAPLANIATRSHAPPVYRNPISMGLPGSIRGPDDVEA